MSSAKNHMKRSHRSEKMHSTCAHQMKQFSPIHGSLILPGFGLFTRPGKHRAGRSLRGKKCVAE